MRQSAPANAARQRAQPTQLAVKRRRRGTRATSEPATRARPALAAPQPSDASAPCDWLRPARRKMAVEKKNTWRWTMVVVCYLG